jgi:HEXXH motif-containing protein
MNEMVMESAAPHTFRPTQNIDMLAAAFHRGVNARLEKHVARSPEAAQLFDYNAELIKQSLPLTASCWQPEIGAAIACMSADQPLAAVVHALFALHALRVAGQWKVQLAAPLRLSISGHLFDAQGQVGVHADAGHITISRADADIAPLTLRWTSKGWRYTEAQPPHAAWRYCAPSFINFDGFQDVYLQSWREPPADKVAEIVVDWPVPMLDGADAALAKSSAPQVGDALGVLAQAGPVYLPWISPLLRGIATCPLIRPDMRQSGSFSWHAGVFSCGFPLSTEFLAEVFVHEMSHQHYLLLNSSIPLTRKGSGEEIYYSSLKGKKRTIDKILLTYHATANMTLFWHDLIASTGFTNDSREQELSFVLNHTHSMAEILVDSKELTEAGALLFTTQAALLNERGMKVKTRPA